MPVLCAVVAGLGCAEAAVLGQVAALGQQRRDSRPSERTVFWTLCSCCNMRHNLQMTCSQAGAVDVCVFFFFAPSASLPLCSRSDLSAAFSLEGMGNVRGGAEGW